MDTALWVVVAVAGALIMRAGFAAAAAGTVRSKNCAAVTIRHLVELAAAVLAYLAIGLALQAAANPYLGLQPRLLLGWAVDHLSAPTAALGIAGVIVATGITPGVLAERARFWPALALPVLLAAVIIPISRHWSSPNGWLGRLGFHDFAGAATLHFTAALAAAVAAVFVGPRTGKFNRDGSSTAIPGHSVPLAGLGLFLLLAGWLPFVGALSPLAAVNLLVAAAAGGLASVCLSQVRYDKPDVHLTCAGVLGALVAISAGGDQMRTTAALLVGAVAGLIVPIAILLLDVTFRIDDPSGGVAAHGLGAAWGTLATPILSADLTPTERLKLLGVHALALLTIALLTLTLSTLLWSTLKRTTKIRASEADEFDGLDLAEHDIGAYPDFQQNTIKSYHLREV